MSDKEDVYGAFVDFYGDLRLKLIKNDGAWAVYATRIYSGLNQQRYIFVIVEAAAAPGVETTLNQLDWVSFQTRITDETYSAPTQNVFLDDTRKKVLSDKITCVDRSRDETFYVTDSLPIKIRLLHDPKKNNYLQYPDKAFLYQALETYRCVIDML